MSALTLEEQETWKDIEGYEGMYQVSDRGRVRSLDRDIARMYPDGPHKVRVPGRILAPSKGGKHRNYLYVKLRSDGTLTQRLVHHLVADAFLNKRPRGFHLHHLDGDTSNNDPDNLLYVSAEEHRSLHWSGAGNVKAKLTGEQVLEIRHRLAKPKSSPTRIAREFGVSLSAIKHIKYGRSWGKTYE